MADPKDSVLDATGQTIVLAFDLAGSQIASMPDELAKALQAPNVQSSIQFVLANFALTKQTSGTSQVSDKEARQLVDDLVKKAGGKITDALLDQLKKTPEFRRLEKSLDNLEQALKSTPIGAWVDRNKNILYVVGAGLAIGGAVALYVTKTGGAGVSVPMSQLTGKAVQVFKVGGFSLSGKVLSFKPDSRDVGGALVGAEKWGKLQISVELGVVATDASIKQVEGNVVLKSKDIDLGISGSADPAKKKVNLGITFGIRPGGGIGPITVGVTGIVENGKLTGGKVRGDWKLDKKTTIGVEGQSNNGANQGTVLFSRQF